MLILDGHVQGAQDYFSIWQRILQPTYDCTAFIFISVQLSGGFGTHVLANLLTGGIRAHFTFTY